MPAAWKEFERYVAEIEAALAPLGASVTLSDRIPDLISGNLREVDAAIRYRVGDSAVLVTLECRDRQKVEDSTWIEQLVTKQRSIGATQTIAITSRRFSQPALLKAAHFGIDTRVIRDVRPEDFAELLPLHLRESCFHSVLHSLKIVLYADHVDEALPPFAPETLSQLNANLSDARVFQRPTGEPVSWNDFYKIVQRRDFESLYASVPAEGSSFTALHLILTDELLVDTTRGPRRVREFEATLEIFLRHSTSRMSVQRTSDYSSSTGSVAQAAAYSAEASFGHVAAMAVSSEATGSTHLSWRLLPKKGA